MFTNEGLKQIIFLKVGMKEKKSFAHKPLVSPLVSPQDTVNLKPWEKEINLIVRWSDK